MKYLIVGLGNIGEEYRNTRHNIGFIVLDALAKAFILLKPSTFMNLSGDAVNYWLNKEKIALENLLVIVDDLALPLGSIRMKPKGSAGGHNGLSHINTILGTDEYSRIRFGIGNNFSRGHQRNYVLGEWTSEEEAMNHD